MYITQYQPKRVRHNDNFVYFDKQIKLETIKRGYLTKIAENRNGNEYYKINPLENAVLMHVKNDNHVIINEIVAGINLVTKLSQMPFRTCKVGNSYNRERVKTNVNYSGYETAEFLERIIRSLIEYGSIRKLPKDIHVHHEFSTWCFQSPYLASNTEKSSHYVAAFSYQSHRQ